MLALQQVNTLYSTEAHTSLKDNWIKYGISSVNSETLFKEPVRISTEEPFMSIKYRYKHVL